jgi:hypothetical protein
MRRFMQHTDSNSGRCRRERSYQFTVKKARKGQGNIQLLIDADECLCATSVRANEPRCCAHDSAADARMAKVRAATGTTRSRRTRENVRIIVDEMTNRKEMQWRRGGRIRKCQLFFSGGRTTDAASSMSVFCPERLHRRGLTFCDGVMSSTSSLYRYAIART